MRTSVQTLINKIKRRIDYDIIDSNLDILLVDCLNDSIKVLRQKLLDRGINYEIGGSASLHTTASQAYIDISNVPAACVAALITVAGLVDSGTHSYKITFVTADGEGDVSPASNVVTTVVATDGQVALTAIPVSPSSEVTARNIYRTAAGGSVYKLVAQIANNTATTYTDNIADVALGATAPTISTIPTYSDLVRVTERVNYKAIDVIPYAEFLKFYPDPAAYSSSVPDRCAVWNQRIYFGPTPMSSNVDIFIEFIRHDADLLLTSNLFYENDYDPILLAYTRLEYLRFFNPQDRVAIKTAEEAALRYMDDLVIVAAKNVGQNKQVASRREEYIFGPRLPASVGNIGP
jgi:hypothetical protein